MYILFLLYSLDCIAGVSSSQWDLDYRSNANQLKQAECYFLEQALLSIPQESRSSQVSETSLQYSKIVDELINKLELEINQAHIQNVQEIIVSSNAFFSSLQTSQKCILLKMFESFVLLSGIIQIDCFYRITPTTISILLNCCCTSYVHRRSFKTI